MGRSKKSRSIFDLPDCREANRAIVRLDVHESIGADEAKRWWL
jgi:hypothetical protein